LAPVTCYLFPVLVKADRAEEKREKIELLYPTRAMREPCLPMPPLNKVELQ